MYRLSIRTPKKLEGDWNRTEEFDFRTDNYRRLYMYIYICIGIHIIIYVYIYIHITHNTYIHPNRSDFRKNRHDLTPQGGDRRR